MDIKDLTLRQIEEIQKLYLSQSTNESSFYSEYIGKYVIVRTRNEGINFGKVESLNKDGVVISEAQRIYYHKPKDTKQAWYEGVANSGVSSDSKISSVVNRKVIIEDYSLTICTEESILSIKNKETYGQ